MDVTKVETITQDDGTKLYIYHKPVTLKRKDENGNRVIKYRKIERRYTPKTSREERRAKTCTWSKSLLESNPDMKSGKIYDLYLRKCKEEGISEDDQYMLSSFYHMVRMIKNEENEVAAA